MKLTVAAITRIATEVAELHSFPVRVLGSISSGASNYVEILLWVETAREQPPLAQFGVFRDIDIVALRQHIADQIRRHVTP